eukprot:403349807
MQTRLGSRKLWFESYSDGRYFLKINTIMDFVDYDRYQDTEIKEIMIFCQGTPFKECWDANYTKYKCISVEDKVEFTYNNFYYDNHGGNSAIPLTKRLNTEFQQQVKLVQSPFYLNKTDSIFQISETYYQENFFTITKDQQYTSQNPQQNVSLQLAIYIYPSQDAFEVITIVPKSLAEGLAQIGGYLSLFSIVLFIMRLVHINCLKRDLKNMLRDKQKDAREQGLLTNSQADRLNDREYEKIEEVFSFENFHKLTMEVQNLKSKTVALETELSTFRYISNHPLVDDPNFSNYNNSHYQNYDRYGPLQNYSYKQQPFPMTSINQRISSHQQNPISHNNGSNQIQTINNPHHSQNSNSQQLQWSQYLKTPHNNDHPIKNSKILNIQQQPKNTLQLQNQNQKLGLDRIIEIEDSARYCNTDMNEEDLHFMINTKGRNDTIQQK